MCGEVEGGGKKERERKRASDLGAKEWQDGDGGGGDEDMGVGGEVRMKGAEKHDTLRGSPAETTLFP